MSLEYEQKLDFLLTEIIQTEQTYVEDLEVIIYDYMRPAEEEGIGCRSIKNEDFVKTVFSNIEDVHYFAFYLAEQLEEWSPNVGQCFVNLKPEFDVYIEYCTNFKVALEYLEKARKRHSEVDEWLSEQQKASGKALGLETYLLKPLQRLLKYPLLLKQLLKYVSHSSSDYAAIASAHADIQALALEVNDLQREKEEMEKLFDEIENLPSRLRTLEVDAGEQLRDEIVIQHEGGRKKTRHVFLFERMLLVCKDQTGFTHSIRRKRLLYKSHMLFNQMKIRNLTSPTGAWSAVVKGKTFVFEHLVPGSKEKWLSLLMVNIQKAQEREAQPVMRTRSLPPRDKNVRLRTGGSESGNSNNTSLVSVNTPMVSSDSDDFSSSDDDAMCVTTDQSDAAVGVAKETDAELNAELLEWLSTATYEELYDEYTSNQEDRNVEYDLRLAITERLEDPALNGDDTRMSLLIASIYEKDQYIYELDTRLDMLSARMEEMNAISENVPMEDAPTQGEDATQASEQPPAPEPVSTQPDEKESSEPKQLLMDEDGEQSAEDPEPSMETNSFEDLGEVDSFTEQINTDHHASGITIALDGEPMMEDDEPWEDEGAYEEQPYILADVLYDFTGADETELTVMADDRVQVEAMHDSEGNDDWYLCAIADFDGSVHSGYVPAAYLHIIEDESANEMMEDAMTDGETPDDVLPSMPESIAEADEEDDDDSYLPPPPPEPMETLEEVPSVPSLPELPAPPPSEPLKPLEEVPSVPSVPQLPTPPVLPETPSTPTIPVIAIAAGLASAAQANLRAKKNQSEPGKKAVMDPLPTSPTQSPPKSPSKPLLKETTKPLEHSSLPDVSKAEEKTSSPSKTPTLATKPQLTSSAASATLPQKPSKPSKPTKPKIPLSTSPSGSGPPPLAPKPKHATFQPLPESHHKVPPKPPAKKPQLVVQKPTVTNVGLLNKIEDDRAKCLKVVEGMQKLLDTYENNPNMGDEKARAQTEESLLVEQARLNEYDYCIAQANATGICPQPRQSQKPDTTQSTKKRAAEEEAAVRKAKDEAIEKRKMALFNRSTRRMKDRSSMMERKKNENIEREANRLKLKKLVEMKVAQEEAKTLEADYKETDSRADKLAADAAAMFMTRAQKADMDKGAEKDGKSPANARTSIYEGHKPLSALYGDRSTSRKSGISDSLANQMATLREAQEQREKPGAAPVYLRKAPQIPKKPMTGMRRISPAAMTHSELLKQKRDIQRASIRNANGPPVPRGSSTRPSVRATAVVPAGRMSIRQSIRGTGQPHTTMSKNPPMRMSVKNPPMRMSVRGSVRKPSSNQNDLKTPPPLPPKRGSMMRKSARGVAGSAPALNTRPQKPVKPPINNASTLDHSSSKSVPQLNRVTSSSGSRASTKSPVTAPKPRSQVQTTESATSPVTPAPPRLPTRSGSYKRASPNTNPGIPAKPTKPVAGQAGPPNPTLNRRSISASAPALAPKPKPLTRKTDSDGPAPPPLPTRHSTRKPKS